jgi:hypothetical protein
MRDYRFHFVLAPRYKGDGIHARTNNGRQSWTKYETENYTTAINILLPGESLQTPWQLKLNYRYFH